MKYQLIVITLLFVFMYSCNLEYTGVNSGDPHDTSSIYTVFSFSPVSDFAIGPSGEKWILSSRGVSNLDDNGTPINKSDDTLTWVALSDTFNGFRTIAIDESGAKWLVSSGGLSYFDDKGTPSNSSDDTWSTFITDDFQHILIDSSGGKWFTTYINPYGSGVQFLDDNGTPINKSDDTWTTFTTTDGLADNSVKSMAIDAVGGKWFATYFNGGVSYLDDNGTPTNKSDDTWTTFTTADGLANNLVEAIAIDESGGKWIGVWDGDVSYFDDNGTPENKIDDAWLTFYKTETKIIGEVRKITIDASGGKWFASMGGGISFLDDNGTPLIKSDDTWTTFRTEDGLINDYAAKIVIDDLGGKWFVAGDVINYLDDNATPINKADDTFVIHLIGDGLATNQITSVDIDESNGKWFGTSFGVSYLNDGGTPTNKIDDTWAYFSTADGLINNDVGSVLIGSSGEKWFCTYGGGVSCLDDNGTPTVKADDIWTTFTISDGLTGNNVRAVSVDITGDKWFFSSNNGVNCFDDNGTPTNKSDDTWITFTTTDGLAGNLLEAIAIDIYGGKWFATYENGASYFDDNETPANKTDDTWTTFNSLDGLGYNWLQKIAIDSSGGKWIGTSGDGIKYLDDNGSPTYKGDDTWVTFTKTDGLTSDWVGEIEIFTSGEKWFSTGNGISCLDDKGTPLDKTDDKWTTLTTEIFSFTEVAIDQFGGKWIATGAGVYYCP